MGDIRRFFRRLGNALHPAWEEKDLTREVSSHLRLLEDEFRRRGLSPEDAKLAATRAFGGVEQAKEWHRDARSFTWLAARGESRFSHADVRDGRSRDQETFES